MTNASTRDRFSDRHSGPAVAESGGAAPVQLRSALRGQDFAAQESLLTPVQRKAERSPTTRTPEAAPAPVQRRIHRMPAADAADAPVQLKREAGEDVQLKPVVQMRGGKAEAFYGGFTLDGTGVTNAHMFDGEVKGGEPKGLHSYAGGMGGITVLATIGNENGIHIILWTKGAAAVGNNPKCKWSSMFPREMSRGMVCWYIKRFSEGKSTDGAPNDREQRPGTGWSGIQLAGAGDTVYPLCGNSYSSAAGYSNDQRGPGITVANKFYKIANP